MPADIPDECPRCGKSLRVSGAASSMSFFNQEMCCMDCIEAERKHPSYAAAKAAEEAAVRAGDYNFPGVGCPPDLYRRR